MNKLFVLLMCLQYLGTTQQASFCSQNPIEFGIVLDSSSSIPKEEFEKAKEFLTKLLSQFDIGPGKNDIRVSIITYGENTYPEEGFNLDTYKTTNEVIDAIRAIKHRQGPRTDTGLGIKYMHEQQLKDDVVRPTADKISLVFTDGNSQSWRRTAKEAKNARDDNIAIFAIGIGTVSKDELMRIAGNEDRIIRVNSFDDLESIKETLTKKTCFKKAKSAIPAPIMHQQKTVQMIRGPIMAKSCRKTNMADIEFFFSPSDLGQDATAWTTSFISYIIDAREMSVGFRYGFSTGSCPMDRGFNLDKYDSVADVHERLAYYDKIKLTSIIEVGVFSSARGGRDNARDVAVIFVSGGKHAGLLLEERVKELTYKGVEVFIANAGCCPVNIRGATTLTGRTSRQQSQFFIQMLCS